MTPGTSPEIRETQTNEPLSFDALAYLDARAQKDDFIMVEFGHDARPVAYKQPNLTGGRAYIGFEAWLRDPLGEKKARVQEQHEAHLGDAYNIHYQTLALGGMVRTFHEFGATEREFIGEYDTATPLTDGSVEEVFLNNVFGDYDVADSPERTETLLGEAARILSPDGVLIVRESLTPFKTMFNFEHAVTNQGLEVLSRIELDTDEWHALEALYANNRMPSYGSYYLFLAKPSAK